MALWYIRAEGRQRATVFIRDGIQRYNNAHDNPNGYHETITLAWVAVIEQFLGATDGDVAVSVLASELLEACGEKDYLLRFYSRGASVLGSGEAPVGYAGPGGDPLGMTTT